MNRRQRVKIPNQDLDAARTLASTLAETEIVPILDRWTMALELLPDDLLRYVMQARNRNEADLMNLLGPLSLVSAQALLGIDHTHPEFPMIATVASYGIMTSFAVELERRHQHFTSHVVNLNNPFNLQTPDGVDPFTLIPKDPEGEPVTLDTLMDYYGKPNAGAVSASNTAISDSADSGSGATDDSVAHGNSQSAASAADNIATANDNSAAALDSDEV